MATGTYTWTGTNGAAWDSTVWQTINNAGGSSTVDIQSNKGHVTNSTTVYAASQATFFEASRDLDITIRVTWANPIVEQYFIVAYHFDWWSANNAWPENGYHFEIAAQSHVVKFTKDSFSARTDIDATATYTPTAGTDTWVRVQISGSANRLKVWTDGTSEPGTWLYDITDTTYPAGGKWGIATSSGVSATQMSVDDLTYDTGPLVPYMAQEIGDQVTNTAATTTVLSFTGAVKPQIGDLVVVNCSRDDAASEAATPTGDSFTDSHSNTYTKVVAGSGHTDATAANGNVGVFFYSFLTTAWSGTETLTWTHPSTKAAMQVRHWRNAASLRASGTNSAVSTAGAPSVALTTPVQYDLVLAMESLEYSTAGTSTGDSDTVGGPWIPIDGPTATTGTTLAACKVISQYKIVSTTGTQTFNPTHSVTTNVDAVAIIAAFVPTTAAASSADLGTATAAITANNLSRLGQYSLGTASVPLTASPLSSTRTLGQASVALSAFGLTVGAITPTANLGLASVGITANALSGSRNLGTATLATVANLLATSPSRALGTATLAITGLDFDSIVLGAEVLGQTRTLPQASVGITASSLTYGGQGLLPQASVAIAANLLASTRQAGTATIALTANQLAIAAQLASASVGISAFSFSEALNLIAATVGINASNLNNLSPVPTANVGTVANNFSSGRQLSQASIAVLAQNLALTGSYNLGTATVGISAFGLLNQTSGNAFLQPASVSVNAGNLSVSLSAGLAASVGVAALGLAHAAALSSPSVATTAANLSQLRSATLGLASVVATAYNLSTLSAGSAPLGTANVAITAFALSNTLLLSTGLASVSIAALPVTYLDSPATSVASVGTVATKLASTRQAVAGLIDIAAYGLGSPRSTALGTASVSLTAYGLSTDVGTTRGQTSTRPGMVGIKTRGVLVGTRTAVLPSGIQIKPGG